MQDMIIGAAWNAAVEILGRERVARAKRAFTTRRVAIEDMRTLISGPLAPAAGDLVMARVDELGKHRRVELPDGRRANLFPGDEIIVCFGNRYAPDQFEAVIGEDCRSCDLVAGGGIAACELSRHDRMAEPTRITPIGLVGDRAGQRLNVRDYGLAEERGAAPSDIVAILSVGTSMNAGKTLAATSLLHGLKAAGFRVAGIKATGTGSGGDLWIMRDAGADLVLDFTDAGFASTYLSPVAELEAAALRLVAHAAASGCDVAVIEIADGLQQLETSALIRSERLRQAVAGVVFSAYDAMGAKCGVDTLRAAGHRVIALSGRLAQSPLGMREAQLATGLRVYTPWELQAGALVEQILARESPASAMEAAALRVTHQPPAPPASLAHPRSGPAPGIGHLMRVTGWTRAGIARLSGILAASGVGATTLARASWPVSRVAGRAVAGVSAAPDGVPPPGWLAAKRALGARTCWPAGQAWDEAGHDDEDAATEAAEVPASAAEPSEDGLGHEWAIPPRSTHPGGFGRPRANGVAANGSGILVSQ